MCKESADSAEKAAGGGGRPRRQRATGRQLDAASARGHLPRQRQQGLAPGRSERRGPSTRSRPVSPAACAKNQSGEVIDRKEINFTAEPRSRASRRTAPRPLPTPQASVPPAPARPSPRPACRLRRRRRRHRRLHRQRRGRAKIRRRTQPGCRRSRTASSTPLLGAAGIGGSSPGWQFAGVASM